MVADPGAHVLPRAAGVPDDWFEHDGQITKREFRAVTLAQLRRGAANSYGTSARARLCRHRMDARGPGEWRGRDRGPPRPRGAVARNALSFGVPGLSVVAGQAPQAFADLPTPDAVFIGGGAGSPD